MERALYLAKHEHIDSDNTQDIALASLFHDTGFSIAYDENEAIGAKIAKNYLQSIKYPTERIQLIESLILATDPDTPAPSNILEQIIKDADLDNLGTEAFTHK